MKERQDEESLLITKDVKIKVGQTVPVREHKRCSGGWGSVTNINASKGSGTVLCDKCGRKVMLDRPTLIKQSRSRGSGR